MRDIILVIFSVIIFSGCAKSVMPDSYYAPHAGLYVGLQRCVAQGYIQPQFAGDAISAQQYTLSTWQIDQSKYSAIINDANSYYNVNGVNQAQCNQIAMNASTLMNSVRDHIDAERYQQRQVNEAFNEINRSLKNSKPVFCNTTGTMTTCY